ncbi:MAG: YjbQ family protein [Planctomycetes bacterium]|nr:YjbQ family protein [Planctomycetota bacterium]
MTTQISIKTPGQGLHLITSQIEQIVRDEAVDDGLCTIFVQHTSASLTIQENADPSARIDLENWLNRLVPENDSLYTHTDEGPDDMPSHIKAALTSTTLSIPIHQGRLALGTWQGIYLWEHRTKPKVRKIVVHICS